MATLYFAYGSNMDGLQMKRRCPNAALIGRAVLRDFLFILDGRGAANIVRRVESQVHGALWRLSPDDESTLDWYEGVRHGVYRKEYFPVLTPSDESVHALVYVGSNSERGRPRSTEYMNRIVVAATEHGLPQAYIAELCTWLKTSS